MFVVIFWRKMFWSFFSFHICLASYEECCIFDISLQTAHFLRYEKTLLFNSVIKILMISFRSTAQITLYIFIRLRKYICPLFHIFDLRTVPLFYWQSKLKTYFITQCFKYVLNPWMNECMCSRWWFYYYSCIFHLFACLKPSCLIQGILGIPGIAGYKWVPARIGRFFQRKIFFFILPTANYKQDKRVLIRQSTLSLFSVLCLIPFDLLLQMCFLF